MFSIIISEKGGAERREGFDKNEINVGRVQGNDLMLPKGNVSKHHARLLYRDGRFIVTDLKSTNGTYVNGRKIAQATIVREGDKIYIGDFVLRLDAGSAADVQPPPDDESVRTLARGSNNNAGASQPLAAQPQPPPQQSAPRQAPAPAPSDPDDDDSSPPPPPPAPKPPVAQPVAQPAPAPRQPAQPPVGNAVRGQTLNLNQQPRASAAGVGVSTGVQRSGSTAAPPQASPNVPPVAATSPAAQVPANLVPAAVLPVAPARLVPRETAQQAGRRLALLTLIDQISDEIDLAPLRTSPVVDDALSRDIERVAREQATAMRQQGELNEAIDLELLVGDAHRELVGLGPLAPLLEDDEVAEIQCVRNDQVLALRAGQITLADAPFTSDEALGRAIARLAHQSGDPRRDGELVIERRLARGAHMVAITPPAAASHALVIRKRRKVDATLEDLVRLGAMSRPMAVFLDACVQARANVLASAPSGTSTATLVSALASAAPPGERVALLSDVEEASIAQALVIAFSLADRRQSACEEVVRAAARLRPDRLVLASLPTGASAALIEAIAEGAEGVIAAGAAPSLRHLLARLTSQIVLSRPGLDADAARECIADAFDVAIEVITLADGRPRILRIAEMGGTDANRAPRDLFTWTPDASGDGTFQSAGVIPRAVNEFAARGVKLDVGIFKRGR